jgi:hypothetical protein
MLTFPKHGDKKQEGVLNGIQKKTASRWKLLKKSRIWYGQSLTFPAVYSII